MVRKTNNHNNSLKTKRKRIIKSKHTRKTKLRKTKLHHKKINKQNAGANLDDLKYIFNNEDIFKMYFELFMKEFAKHIKKDKKDEKDEKDGSTQIIKLIKSDFDKITGNECNSTGIGNNQFNEIHCELFFINMYMLLKKSFTEETFSITIPISKQKQLNELENLKKKLEKHQNDTQNNTQNNNTNAPFNFNKSFVKSFIIYINNILSKNTDVQTGGDLFLSIMILGVLMTMLHLYYTGKTGMNS